MEEPKKKERRTPEELAAHFQKKANAARAKAKRTARSKRLNLQIELGKAALEAGLDTTDLVKAAAARGQTQPARSTPVEQAMAQLLVKMFGPKGTVTVGEKGHWEALAQLGKPSEEQRALLFEHWQSQGWPLSK